MPEVYDLRVKSKNEIEVSGFYFWRDVDGKIRRKYAKFIHVKARTADDVGLMVVTTAYVDDYKVISNVSERVNSYLKSFDYYNLVLVSLDGYIIYGAKQIGVIGTNLEWISNADIGISKNYLESKKSGGISFYGPFVGIYGDVYPKVSIAAPVYADGVLLGFVIVVNDMDEIFDVSEETVGFRESQESYLVDSTGLLISPLRSREFDVMVQSVESKNFGNCFDEYFSRYLEGKEFADYFLNYKGEEVLGIHREIANIDWCLLTEVAVDEALTVPIRESVKKSIYFSAFGLLVWVLIEFFVKFYLSRRKLFVKKGEL